MGECSVKAAAWVKSLTHMELLALKQLLSEAEAFILESDVPFPHELPLLEPQSHTHL